MSGQGTPWRSASPSTLSPGAEHEASPTESEGEGDPGPTELSMAVDSVSPRPIAVKSSELAPIPPSAFYGAAASSGEDQDERVDELDGDDKMDVDVSTSALEQPESVEYVTGNRVYPLTDRE